jgi:outer membrane protein OmpA-like peptidoglycan-associated protein
VLLGDPPIDWSAVTSPADDDLNDARDAHAADVVAREVMHRRQRALILYGGAHLSRRVVLPNSLIHLLDARFPGRTWVAGVLDYTRVDAGIRQRLPMNGMPTGSSVRNTWLGKLDGQRIGFGLSRGLVEEDVDALLVFSTAPPRLQQAPPLEEEYSLELARRRALGTATLPFRGGKIRFVEGRETLAADADAPLHAVLEELRRDRGLRLLIKGHADRSEPDADALSARRAHIVVAWLAARGVSADRLTATGCGARRPITFGSTDEERAANRWAELVRLTVRAGCDPAW